MTIWRRQGVIAAACGFGFLALFGAGFVVLNVIASDLFPSPFDSGAEIQRYFVQNRDEVRVVSACYALATVCLLALTAFLADVARRSVGEMGALPSLTFGGGVLASAFLMASALCFWLLGRETTGQEPALVRTLHDLTYLAGGPAHVVAFAPFLGASGVAALRSRVLPGWIAWLGIAAAAPSFASVLALLWEPATYVIPLARVITYGWIAAVSVALALGWPRQSDEADQGVVAEAFRIRPDRIAPPGAPPRGGNRSRIEDDARRVG